MKLYVLRIALNIDNYTFSTYNSSGKNVILKNKVSHYELALFALFLVIFVDRFVPGTKVTSDFRKNYNEEAKVLAKDPGNH